MSGNVHIMGCCGEGPCTLCGSDALPVQPNAAATVAGVCAGPLCSGAEDTYFYSGFDEDYPPNGHDDECGWTWNGIAAQLWITYNRVTGAWWAIITTAGIHYEADVTGDVSCDGATGKLVGNFTLPGLDPCVGCTASVTLDI